MVLQAISVLRYAVPLSVISWLVCLWRSQSLNEVAFQPTSSVKLALTVLLPSYLAYDGMRRKNLTLSGTLAAMFMGAAFCLVNYCFLISLLAFYFLASKATKFRLNQKTFERDPEKGSVRTWVNVLCNGGVALHLASFYYLEVGCREMPIDFVKLHSSSWWIVGVLAAMASASGDTFASELGTVLPLSQPYLVINLKKVPKGTNGGVSFAGTLASCLGGMVVGMAFYLSVNVCASDADLERSAPQWPIIPVCSLAGLIGSFLDSVLGATLQYSGVAEDGCVVEQPDKGVKHISGAGVLDNHAINLLSAALTSICMPGIAQFIWGLVNQ